MNRFTFRYPEWREMDPPAWVAWWAARYGDGDNKEYFDLIAFQGVLSAEDFEQVGKWKQDCLKPGNGRWKTGTPTAYDVWMQAKAELPECPETSGVSGGRYPILDSRVMAAMIRLGSPITDGETIGGYLNSFCPLFSDLAVVCNVSGVRGLRTPDNALFMYGAESS